MGSFNLSFTSEFHKDTRHRRAFLDTLIDLVEKNPEYLGNLVLTSPTLKESKDNKKGTQYSRRERFWVRSGDATELKAIKNKLLTIDEHVDK